MMGIRLKDDIQNSSKSRIGIARIARTIAIAGVLLILSLSLFIGSEVPQIRHVYATTVIVLDSTTCSSINGYWDAKYLSCKLMSNYAVPDGTELEIPSNVALYSNNHLTVNSSGEVVIDANGWLLPDGAMNYGTIEVLTSGLFSVGTSTNFTNNNGGVVIDHGAVKIDPNGSLLNKVGGLFDIYYHIVNAGSINNSGNIINECGSSFLGNSVTGNAVVTLTCPTTVTNTVTLYSNITSLSTITETLTQSTTIYSTVTLVSTSTETSVSTTTETSVSTTTLPPVTTTTTVTSVPSPVTITTTETSTSISSITTTETSTRTVTAAAISISCSPPQPGVGRTTKCTATAIAGNPPAGIISFASSVPTGGTFGTMKCTTSANMLTCTIPYTPSSAGRQQITATYSADPNFLSMSATATINVKP